MRILVDAVLMKSSVYYRSADKHSVKINNIINTLKLSYAERVDVQRTTQALQLILIVSKRSTLFD
jgi:hypothetical protein